MSEKDPKDVENVEVEAISDEDLDSVAGGLEADSLNVTSCCSVNASSCCSTNKTSCCDAETTLQNAT